MLYENNPCYPTLHTILYLGMGPATNLPIIHYTYLSFFSLNLWFLLQYSWEHVFNFAGLDSQGILGIVKVHRVEPRAERNTTSSHNFTKNSLYIPFFFFSLFLSFLASIFIRTRLQLCRFRQKGFLVSSSKAEVWAQQYIVCMVWLIQQNVHQKNLYMYFYLPHAPGQFRVDLLRLRSRRILPTRSRRIQQQQLLQSCSDREICQTCPAGSCRFTAESSDLCWTLCPAGFNTVMHDSDSGIWSHPNLKIFLIQYHGGVLISWNRNRNWNQGFKAWLRMESVDFLLESETESDFWIILKSEPESRCTRSHAIHIKCPTRKIRMTSDMHQSWTGKKCLTGTQNIWHPQSAEGLSDILSDRPKIIFSITCSVIVLSSR